MKKVFALLVFSISLNSNAQMYYPFPTDSAMWTVDFASQVAGFTHFPSGYIIQGDSLLNGFVYTKIYHSDSTGTLINTNPLALLREQSKVIYCRYIAQPIVPGEVEIYNFNLNVTDTFSIPNAMGTVNYIVTSIDSELTLTGYRKAINLSYISGSAWFTMYTMRWVEGIGDITNGIIYFEVPWVDWWCEALCYYHPTAIVWSNNNSYCWLSPTGVNELSNQKNNFSCLPNPSLEKITVSFYDNHELKTIDVYDTKGIFLRSFLTNEQQFIFNKKLLGSGLFILKVKIGSDFIGVKKIIFN